MRHRMLDTTLEAPNTTQRRQTHQVAIKKLHQRVPAQKQCEYSTRNIEIVADEEKHAGRTWVLSRLQDHRRGPLDRLCSELDRHCPRQPHPYAAVRQGLDQDEDVRRTAAADAGDACIAEGW